MDITVNGGNLPPGLREMAEKIAGASRKPDIRPAMLADLQCLLKGDAQPKFEVGDKVNVRERFASKYVFPAKGEVCIITQVLDTPYRAGNPDSPAPAHRGDIAIAFVDQNDGELIELLFDRRHFEKVGSIYDPITLPDGEVLPVV